MRAAIVVFALCGCEAELVAHDGREATSPRSDLAAKVRPADVPPAQVQAIALPGSDGKELVLETIRTARQTLDAGLYLLTEDTIEDALVAAQERGVAVRVVIDDSEQTHAGNLRALEALQGAGVAIEKATGVRFHHAKYVIADGVRALVMTCNFTFSSFTKNREVVVQTYDEALVAELSAIFSADFAHEVPVLSAQTRLVVSPFNTREKLGALVASAQRRVYVAMQSVDDDATVSDLIARHDAGAEVRVMMADPSVYGKSGDAQRLKDSGVDVRYLPAEVLYLHEKVIVADMQTFVGSVNLTSTSIMKNREIGLIGDASLTELVLPQVEADWAAAVAF